MARTVTINADELKILLRATAPLRRWARTNKQIPTIPAGNTLVQFWTQSAPNKVGDWDGVSAGEVYTIDKVLSKWEKDHKL